MLGDVAGGGGGDCGGCAGGGAGGGDGLRRALPPLVLFLGFIIIDSLLWSEHGGPCMGHSGMGCLTHV